MLWLTENGHEYSERPAMHQMVSWKVKSGPKPIIFDGKSSEHFSCNDASVPFVMDFINKPKEVKSAELEDGKPYQFYVGGFLAVGFYSKARGTFVSNSHSVCDLHEADEIKQLVLKSS